MISQDTDDKIFFYLIAKEIIEQKLGIKALRGDVSRLALLLKTIEDQSERRNVILPHFSGHQIFSFNKPIQPQLGFYSQ